MRRSLHADLHKGNVTNVLFGLTMVVVVHLGVEGGNFVHVVVGIGVGGVIGLYLGIDLIE